MSIYILAVLIIVFPIYKMVGHIRKFIKFQEIKNDIQSSIISVKVKNFISELLNEKKISYNVAYDKIVINSYVQKMYEYEINILSSMDGENLSHEQSSYLLDRIALKVEVEGNSISNLKRVSVQCVIGGVLLIILAHQIVNLSTFVIRLIFNG